MEIELNKGDWTDWGRFIAQDADGWWYIYRQPPVFWKVGYWKNSQGTSEVPDGYKWCALCNTPRIPNNEKTIIDIEKFKETYGS